MAAGYFQLQNTGERRLNLVGASSPAFGSVDMHETQTVDGLSRMRPLREMALSPGTTLKFEPGGAHLMLSGATTDLAGQKEVAVELRLVDESGKKETLTAGFKLEPGAGTSTTSDDDHSGHHH